MCLGKHMKYSCCLYPTGSESLDDAEQAMLELYCERAQLKDGMAILDLGCGWGSLSLFLAQAIVRDGEGATKFMTIHVEAGKDVEECRKVAYAIAHSPLIKTAFFASDPNLGRILAAIGYAGIDDLDVNTMQLYLGDVLVAEKGGRAASYVEEQGAAVMKESDILVRVVLNRGKADATVWTCDFSYDYVKINADYRS